VAVACTCLALALLPLLAPALRAPGGTRAPPGLPQAPKT